MGLRELFILILILAIVGVILRGLHLALRARRGQLRISLDKNVPQYDPEELSLSELPNGGARMVERSFAEVVRKNSEFSSRQSKTKSEHAIPVLMDSVEDEDDEDVAAASGSGVANARQAVRQKQLLGAARPRPPQRPTHRPIDRMARSAAGASAVVSGTPSESAPVGNRSVTIEDSPSNNERGFDFDYDDPLDSHVFKDSEDDRDYRDDEAPAASFDAAYGEYSDDEQSHEEELDELEADLPYQAPSEDAAAAWEMEEEEYNEGGLEESIDEAVSEVPGQSRESVITQIVDEAYDEDDLDDEFDDEDLDDAELEDNEFDDDEIEPVDDYDDDYYDEEDEDDTQNDDEYQDDPEQVAEVSDYDNVQAFGSVYADDDTDDDYEYDENFADDDYVDEAMDEQKSGPRRWLQWAGDKLAAMGAATAEERSTPEVRSRDQRPERAEPTISASSFDEIMGEPPAAAPVPRRNAMPHRSNIAVDKSYQSELNLDDPETEESPFDDSPHSGSDRDDSARHRTDRSASQNSNRNDSARAGFTLGESTSAGESSRTASSRKLEPSPAPAKAPEPEPAIAPDYSEVLVLNIFAKPDREFAGVDLLQTLLAAGLHFGEMSIFHRHVGGDTSSPVVFSVANLVNPGTFDLNQISAFSTKGLCFFMTLPNVANSMQAFDKMLDAAQQIRIGLDGDLKDDNRSVMTAQTIEHYRQRVRDFDLRQLRQPK